MTDIPIVGEMSKQQEIDVMTVDVVALLEEVPLGEGELIGIVELSMLDTISNLAGYMYEMQKQILLALGTPPDLNAPTADDFAQSYIEDYTLLRIKRTRALLRSHLHDNQMHDRAARDREDAVQEALEAEDIAADLRAEGHAVKVVIGDSDNVEGNDGE